MLCPAPLIDVPDSVLQLITKTTINLEASKRKRRHSEENDLSVSMGFQLDGLPNYRNYTANQTLQFLIFLDPEVERFDEVKVHRPYWPYRNELLQILVGKSSHFVHQLQFYSELTRT